MKLSQHIAKMEAILAQYGEMDMVCTEGYQVPENVAMQDRHIEVVQDRNFAPTGVSAPYVLLGGGG